MKKYYCLLFAIICICTASKAAPGDTTWVQANNVQMTYTGNYDSAVVFPNTGVTYRKILMIFTLGKYSCPSGSTYCASWDYIVNNYLMTPGGDTMEISRLITPYATTSTYYPGNWTFDYVFDVTDYAAYLNGNATVRIDFGGYSYGFTANVRFAFIEGTPDRNVLGFQRLWHGQFNYGDTSDPITNHVYPLTSTVPAGTVTTDLKMRITGHGEDGNDCNEFCSNSYDVILNNSDIYTENFFRNTCGVNPVYAQTGTWPYDRSGWCPGAMVYDIYNPLPGVAGTYTVNATFPAYTTVPSSSGNSAPTFDIEGATINYGGINKTLDASLEEILAPNVDPNYSRTNTVCGQPIVHVHNAGSTTITSISINYGIAGGTVYNYVWNSTLAPLQDSDITLPNITDLQTNAGLVDTMQFTANILLVNGQTDDDPTNNTLTSRFTQAPIWQNDMFVLKFKTSGVAMYNESWVIEDMNNNIVASRTNTTQETLYIDTVSLNWYTCYKLVMSTPDGYGLLFGNYYTGSTSNNGYLLLFNYNGPQITVPNYRGADFGSGFTQYFTTSPWPARVTNQVAGNESMEAYPNPARDMVNIDISGVQQVNGAIHVLDALGRLVIETTCNTAQNQINVSELANGVYTILFIDSKQPDNKLTTRLLIAK